MEGRDGARDGGVCRSKWGARSACGEAAGSVARMIVTVSRGEASGGQRPARAGIPPGSKTTLVDAQKAAEFYPRLVIEPGMLSLC